MERRAIGIGRYSPLISFTTSLVLLVLSSAHRSLEGVCIFHCWVTELLKLIFVSFRTLFNDTSTALCGVEGESFTTNDSHDLFYLLYHQKYYSEYLALGIIIEIVVSRIYYRDLHHSTALFGTKLKASNTSCS